MSDPPIDQPLLVHDYLLVMRGAERTFAAMCDLWPGAPVATLLHDRSVFEQRLAGHPVRTSSLQRLGAKQSTFKLLLPFLASAAERLDVSGHPLIVSSSSAFAHGVRPDPGAVHVCYCHTPFRYAWHERAAGLAQAPRVARPLLARRLDRHRDWDEQTAQRETTTYIANGLITQERMQRLWGVDAPVVYPPVELGRFAPAEPEDYFLLVCELVKHKRVDLALRAARRAGARVKVVGGGTDEPRLRSLYGDHAEFVGRVDDGALAALYAGARALIMPNVEEFGITAVEAQASGRPVIAAAAGGALETVVDGETGVLVTPGDVDALAEVLSDGTIDRLEPAAAVANAQRFSVAAFRDALRLHVDAAVRGEHVPAAPCACSSP